MPRGKESEGQIPEQVGPGDLRRLIDGTLTKTAAKARRDERRLLDVIGAQGSYDFLLLAADELQGRILSARDAKVARAAHGLLVNIIARSLDPQDDDVVIKQSTVSEKLKDQIGRIQASADRLRQNPFTHSLRAQEHEADVHRFYAEIIPGIIQTDTGSTFTYIPHTPPGLSIDELKALTPTPPADAWKTWAEEMGNATNAIGETDRRTQEMDLLITYLRREPKNENGQNLYESKYRGLSLKDIEGMAYPLSDEDFSRVTDYLHSYFAAHRNAAVPREIINAAGQKVFDAVEFQRYKPWIQRGFIESLFSRPNYFYDERLQPIARRNTNLLAIANQWQEQALFALYKAQPPGDRFVQRIRDVISLMPDESPHDFFNSIGEWTFRVAITDPAPLEEQGIKPHPFMLDMYDAATTASEQELIKLQYFSHPEDVKMWYVKAKVLPQFQTSLRRLGLSRFLSDLDRRVSELSQQDFKSVRVNDIVAIFEDELDGTLKRLDERQEVIQHGTTALWSEISRGVHTLPLAAGIDVIRFSPDSLPAKLKVANIILNKEGNSLNVRFNFNVAHADYLGTTDAELNTPTFLVGRINEHGEMILATPIADRLPGLTAMLNRIGISSIKDLCVQQEKQRVIEQITPRAKPAISDAEAVPTTNDDEEKDEERNGHVRIYQAQGRLPRVRFVTRSQTDRELEDELKPKRKINPHRIGVHPMSLAGTREFCLAANDYEFAVQYASLVLETNEPQQEVEMALGYMRDAQEAVENARERMRKISPGKLDNWPAPPFERPIAIEDPTVGKQVFQRRTWVIEHTTPKLSEQEEHEVIIWQRNYPASDNPTTALGSLDVEFEDLISS